MDSSRELERVKRYMRLEGHEDDALVLGLARTAEEYLRDAGVPRPPKGTGRYERYLTALSALTLSYYDPADPVGENPALRRLIQQLKLTEPEGDSG